MPAAKLSASQESVNSSGSSALLTSSPRVSLPFSQLSSLYNPATLLAPGSLSCPHLSSQDLVYSAGHAQSIPPPTPCCPSFFSVPFQMPLAHSLILRDKFVCSYLRTIPTENSQGSSVRPVPKEVGSVDCQIVIMNTELEF